MTHLHKQKIKKFIQPHTLISAVNQACCIITISIYHHFKLNHRNFANFLAIHALNLIAVRNFCSSLTMGIYLVNVDFKVIHIVATVPMTLKSLKKVFICFAFFLVPSNKSTSITKIITDYSIQSIYSIFS